MQKRNLSWIFAVLITLTAVFMGGCASMPDVDTPGKRFAVFEISYQEILKTAILYKQEKRLSDDQTKRLDDLFSQMNTGRELALRAWLDNDMPAFDNRMQALTGALQLMRAVLVEAESHGQ